MVRRTGTSRVGGGDGGDGRPASAEPTRYPSLRERRPVVFWVVIVAAAAMVLSLAIPFATAFL